MTHTYEYRKDYRYRVVVQKSKFRLLVYRGKFRTPIKSYPIGIGRNRKRGTKQREGDNRTPEGVYYVCQKESLRPGKLGTRWMRLTYPNLTDIRNALKAGIVTAPQGKQLRRGYQDRRFSRIETPLGFGIGIHGTNRPSCIGTRCSDGCIRLRNVDVEELFGFLPVGTRVEIRA